jgi:hypothetical protein
MIAAAVTGSCVVLIGLMYWTANAMTEMHDEPWDLEDDE